VVVTFDLIPLRIHCRAGEEIHLNGNLLRGRFGKALRELDRNVYDRLFEPRQIEGPSGLRDAPRPFVFRVREKRVASGEAFQFGFHLFDLHESVDLLVRAFSDVERVEGRDVLQLPLAPELDASRVRVTFLTPTELKGADRPEFGVLFGRIRDRVSTLRSLYQGGPIDLDFKSMGERAALVKMTRCEIQHVDAARTSRRTGQTHSLGGFVGVAEYEGELGEFLPYLEVARWTGVGRQTVWGKGEIVCETF
jgi:hypothetical protein